MRSNQAWLAALAGLGFAVLIVVGLLLLGDMPAGDDPDSEIVDFWADSDNQTKALISLFLMAGAAVCFLWFIGQVRARLFAAEGAPGTLATISFASGVVFVAMLSVAGVAFNSIGAAQKFDEPTPGADVARWIPTLGYPALLVFGAWAASLSLAAASWVILASGGFPRWVGWLGLVCAVALLFSFAFIPMMALPIWVLAASYEMWRAPRLVPLAT